MEKERKAFWVNLNNSKQIYFTGFEMIEKWTSWVNYFDLDFLPSTYCAEGLIGLSVRWIQPTQQQGRRIPFFSSVRTLPTCWLLVLDFLTDIVQQIHSLRASGVRSSHAASAFGSEVKATHKSDGILCATPLEISFLVMSGVLNHFKRRWMATLV